MSNEELKNAITSCISSTVFEEGGEFLTVFSAADDFPAFAKNLRNSPELDFDYLFCLTCVDWKEYLAMVYHFTSRKYGHTLVVKVKLTPPATALPRIGSVSDLWRTAEFHEREVYDMFGVWFLNHPDMRRILLDEDWKGYPLRKDYVDKVNMIEL